MNKHLRNCLLHSGIGVLRDIAVRSVRRAHARRHASLQAAVYQQLYPQGGTPKVLNGPFAGMLYLNEPVWGSITPRWIGSYESCLWGVVHEIIAKRYQSIIDVGCAEGYYAVGLCRALPTSNVYAHDMDRYSLAQVERLWRLNGNPGTLLTGGSLNTSSLDRLGSPGTLLICDIEGGEMDLLDPVGCAALRRMDMLVEVHQTRRNDIKANAATLRQRFAPSHEISTFDDTHRAKDLSGLSVLDDACRVRALAEGRPADQLWLWLKSR
jgi:hypothetical protein